MAVVIADSNCIIPLSGQAYRLGTGRDCASIGVHAAQIAQLCGCRAMFTPS
jgi:hypothetical protein